MHYHEWCPSGAPITARYHEWWLRHFHFFGMVAQGYDAIFKIFEMVARWEEPTCFCAEIHKTHNFEKLKNGGAGV